jgi:hypothetical protein
VARRVECHAAINSITKEHFGRTPDRWLFNYAHAVVEDRLGADYGAAPTTLKLAAVALYAAVRWNGSVSADMLKTLARWLVADSSRPVRERLARSASRSRT